MSNDYNVSKFLHIFQKESKSVLVNCLRPRPLLVTKGNNFILEYIKGFDKGIKGNDEKLNKILSSHNIIVSNEKNIRTNSEVDMKDNNSIDLYLIVDHNCNMACTYCLAGSKTYKRNQRMTFPVAREALEKTSKLISDGNTLTIIFFGGEPLLNSKLIFEIVKYVETVLKHKFSNINYRYAITSNLTVLNDNIVSLFKDYNFDILTDIDGRKFEHDITRPYISCKSSYDDTIKNIDILLQNGSAVSVRCTVTSVNVDSLPLIYEDFKARGYKNQTFSMLVPFNSDKNAISSKLFPKIDSHLSFIKEKMIDSLKHNIYIVGFSDLIEKLVFSKTQHFGCGMPLGLSAAVDANGLVYPCIYLVGNKNHCLGSVFDNKQNVFDFSFLNLHVDNREACCTCKVRYICGGGCPLEQFLEKEVSGEVLDYFHKTTCSLVWASFEEACWAIVTGTVKKSTFENFKKYC